MGSQADLTEERFLCCFWPDLAVSEAVSEIYRIPKCLICILLLIAGLLVHSVRCLHLLPPGALLLLLALSGGFSIARDGVSIALFWQNIPHPWRSCWQETLCCAERRINPVKRPRKSPLGSCSCQGPSPSVSQPPGSKGRREAPSLFLAELKCQPGGQGLWACWAGCGGDAQPCSGL